MSFFILFGFFLFEMVTLIEFSRALIDIIKLFKPYLVKFILSIMNSNMGIKLRQCFDPCSYIIFTHISHNFFVALFLLLKY